MHNGNQGSASWEGYNTVSIALLLVDSYSKSCIIMAYMAAKSESP